MTDEVTRTRDAGRSWTEISERLGISVQDAKARVREDKDTRREALAQSQIAEDRNGLRDQCADCDAKCDGLAMRRSHEDFTGVCTGCTCEEFSLHDAMSWLRALRGPRPPEPQYVDPNIQLSDRLSIQAYQLGLQHKVNPPRRDPDDQRYGRFRPYGATIPLPSLKVMARRARKKLKAGKPLKKHWDRPRR